MPRPRSMAWVTYASAAQAAKALGLTGQMVGERDLRVELATRDPTAVREPRGECLQRRVRWR